jgi:hypothetical protein
MSVLTPSPRLRWAGTVLCLLLLAVTGLAAARSGGRIGGWGVLALAALAGFFVVNALSWRCHHCHRYLGRSTGRGYCPHCGQLLS